MFHSVWLRYPQASIYSHLLQCVNLKTLYALKCAELITMLKYEIYSIKVLDLCNFKKHMYKEYLAAKYPLMLDSSTRHTSYNIVTHL